MNIVSGGLTAIALSAIAAMASEGERRRAAFYLLKPLTTLLVVGLLLLLPDADPNYRRRLLLAMSACLLGDAALLGRSERAFTLGLAAFLVGHLIFIAAFVHGLARFALPPWSALALPYALGGLAVLWPRAGALRLPVLVYVAALLAMWLAAALRLQVFGDRSAALALAGATLFIASDSLLAWQRFVGRYRFADTLVLSSYWSAMALLALSAAGSGAA